METCKRGHPRTEENTCIRSNGSRTCAECRRENARGKYNAAAAAAKKAMRQRKKNDPDWVEKERQRARRYQKRLKRAVIEKYGGICACCAEARLPFLTIDHKNRDGRRDRATVGSGFYQVLRQAPLRTDLRVMCMNCNFAIRHGEPCPHTQEDE